MFTAAKIRNGDTYLQNHLSANDYYSKGERVTGMWLGLGAEKLGLSGEVTLEHFEALRTNLHPITGAKLTPRTKETRLASTREAELDYRKHFKKEGTSSEVEAHRLKMGPLSNRVAFFDFQCSAQKSVSIMAMVGGDDRLREAHERASRVGLQELERFASRQNNQGRVRQVQITGNVCAAAFTHDSSRALDPQLHTHFVIANATQDASGKWVALNESVMLESIRYAGKVYQNELAREVQALGYNLREVREKGVVTGFEIKGVSEELCQRFAKRRAEIELEIKKFTAAEGREPTATEVHTITKQTRPAALKEIATNEVRKLQFAQLTPGEWNQLHQVHVEARAQAGKTSVISYEKEALKNAVDHLFERKSVFSEQQILAEALNQKLGANCLDELKKLLPRDPGLIRLAEHEREPLLFRYATKAGLDLERRAVAWVNQTQGQFPALHPNFQPSEHLSAEQGRAVKAILAQGDQIYGFRGLAGTGKTTILKEVQRGLEEKKIPVLALAPTTSAVEVLKKEGFAHALTVAAFLQKPEVPASRFVLCDEAGLQSNRQGALLLQLARERDLRVLLVGDSRQHGSVEAGDFLRVLETHSRLGCATVGEIRRQQHEAYRRAIQSLASGQARAGMTRLDRLGWVKEGAYLKEAAHSYLTHTQQGRDLDRCLAVAPTWAENHQLTREIREQLKARDILPKDEVICVTHQSLNWTKQQKVNCKNYQPGQIVHFHRRGESFAVARVADKTVWLHHGDSEKKLPLHQPDSFDVHVPRSTGICVGDKILLQANWKKQGLINGQILTVKTISEGGIETKEDVSLPASFKQWTHGYVVTSHQAQGRTCDHVVVAAAKLDAKSAYVACSRGRHTCTVHTPDKTELLARLPEGHRPAALDVLAEKFPELHNRTSLWDQLENELRQAQQKIAHHLEKMRLAHIRFQQQKKRLAQNIKTIPSEKIAPPQNRYTFTPQPAQKHSIRL